MSDVTTSRLRRASARVAVLALPALAIYAFAAPYVAH